MEVDTAPASPIMKEKKKKKSKDKERDLGQIQVCLLITVGYEFIKFIFRRLTVPLWWSHLKSLPQNWTLQNGHYCSKILTV